MAILQFYPKHGIGQGIDDRARELNLFFLRHCASIVELV